MTLNQRSFRRDDEAVSEVVGYILSFALSAVFLLIALTSFWNAQQNTDSVVTAAEMKTLANRISSRIVESGLIGEEFPNATLSVSIPLPQAINGHPFWVSATAKEVTLTTVDGLYSATSSNLNMDASTVTLKTPTTPITSSNERLIVSYALVANQVQGQPPIKQISLG